MTFMIGENMVGGYGLTLYSFRLELISVVLYQTLLITKNQVGMKPAD